jgi:hypothetical protein
MADKIIQNPSITTNDFEYDGAGRVSAISGHPLAGEGGGEGATYSAGPNIDITDNIISGKDWTPELNAKLDSTAFTLPTSANWDNTYSTVNSESANWTKVYDTVTANSANWNNDLDTLYSAGPNINITDNTISGRDWTTEINAKLDTTAFSLPNSATWDDTYNTVNSNSASWNEVNEYSAGSNIDITDNTISGKDWSNEINAKLDTTAFTLPTSATWDDTYNTVNSNSATWNEVNEYTAGQNINITDNVISSKDWSDEINTKLDTTAFSLPNSANWNNTYDTVSANSAQWSNDTTYSAGPNINITDDVISGKDWSDELNSKLDATAFDSTNWDNTYNTVNSNSAQWSNDTTYTAGSNIDISNGVISGKDWSNELNTKLDTTAFTALELPNSANWDNTYNTVLSNSATWNATGSTYTAGPNIDITNNTISSRDWTPELNAKLNSTAFTLPTSANWDNTYSTVNSESANWNNTYSTVTANSASWDEVTDYSAGPNIDITDNIISGKDWTPELNAKLDSTAFTLSESANWNNTYSTVNSESANWNSVSGLSAKGSSILCQNISYTATGSNINVTVPNNTYATISGLNVSGTINVIISATNVINGSELNSCAGRLMFSTNKPSTLNFVDSSISSKLPVIGQLPTSYSGTNYQFTCVAGVVACQAIKTIT